MLTLINTREDFYLPLILQPTLGWEIHTAPSEFFSSSLEKWLDQCLSRMEGTHTGWKSGQKNFVTREVLSPLKKFYSSLCSTAGCTIPVNNLLVSADLTSCVLFLSTKFLPGYLQNICDDTQWPHVTRFVILLRTKDFWSWGRWKPQVNRVTSIFLHLYHLLSSSRLQQQVSEALK